MEQERDPRPNPEFVSNARTVIEALGFGDYADTIVRYRDQELTITEGLALHWDESSKLDAEALYVRIAGYVEIAKQQLPPA